MSQPFSVGQLLNPQSVAVIGATEDQTKFGGRLYRNLIKHGYGGKVFPINPRRSEVFGLKAYSSLSAVPEVPQMVVMAVPRPMVLDNITEAASLGVRGAIIITSKFSDEGAQGAAIEADLVAIARRAGMRLFGPNCLGVISQANKVVLCSSPALEPDTLPLEPIGLVSQSGALMATLFDRARDRGIGFAHCISVGNQADLELCDFAEYFLADERVRTICCYVEGIKDPARFLALAVRARAARKPLLVVKAGRTEMGARASFSHTASLAGSFAAFETVCRERGVVLMDDLDAMVLLASNLCRHGERPVRSACILTTSGGGGAIASDRLAEAGVALTEFALPTRQHLAALYPPGQAANPIDFGAPLADAGDVAGATVTIVAADGAADVILILFTTSPMMPQTTARLADTARAGGKPCLFVMVPGHAADSSRRVLVERRLPFADTLDEAVRTISAWTRMSTAPPWAPPARPSGLPEAGPVPGGQLAPDGVAALLNAYGIAQAEQAVCPDHQAAVASARRIGFPVVLKAYAADLIHKSDAGGVVVNIRDETELKTSLQTLDRRLPDLQSYVIQQMIVTGVELILGIKNDPQFGPMLVVGAGGILVELLQDAALASVPLSETAAWRLLDRLRVKKILDGVRGAAALDVAAVVDTIIRLGWLAYDLRGHLLELDINPLIVRRQGCVVVDARVLCKEFS